LAGIILIGTAWEKSKPFLQLFQRASKDADEITKIRKDVEQQRETIAAVARDATNAHELSAQAKETSDQARKQASEIGVLVQQAGGAVETIRTTADFAFVLARAAADDRKAFDELLAIIMNQPSQQFYDLAIAASARIAGEFDTAFESTVNWQKLGLDPKKLEFEEMKNLFESQPAFMKPAILTELAKQDRFSKYDRLTFLRDVIKSTTSISVLNAACKAMNQEAKIDKNIIGYQFYLDWWFDHIREYSEVADGFQPSGVEQAPDWTAVHCL
jgi:hypothetical protein